MWRTVTVVYFGTIVSCLKMYFFLNVRVHNYKSDLTIIIISIYFTLSVLTTTPRATCLASLWYTVMVEYSGVQWLDFEALVK